ncbi:MAG: formylglycine-generating enzyme family protein [Chitinophagaceae bacterium]|nr:formylglycine-generating enzyme family protein [Chitinophagaceae bacterium]
MRKIGLLCTLIGLTFIVCGQNNSKGTLTAYDQKIPGTSLNLKMVPIKGGSFTMGSSASDRLKHPDETPARKVTVSSFWMGAYEVTHDIFDAFFRDETTPVGTEVDALTRPTPQYIDLSWGMGKTGGYPVNSMSQDGALMFCRWLYKKTGIFYRLPTEAEWEYACRAGSASVYPFGDNAKDLGKYAWFKGNSKKKYHKVGEKLPNAFGLYDMLGNVSEWTLDQYDEKYFETIGDHATDPVIPPGKRYPRSVRGGSFADDAGALRSADRQHSDPSWNKRDPQIPRSRWWLTDAEFVGFRVVRPEKQPTAKEAEAFYNKYLNID